MTQTLPLCRRVVVFGSSLAMLILLVAAPAVRADDKTPAAPVVAPQGTADRVNAMLKSANYFYQRINTPGQPTMFKVMIQDDKNRTSIIILKVLTWTWKYADGTVAESLYGYVQTVE